MIPVSAGIVAFDAIDELRTDPTGSRDKTARAELRTPANDQLLAYICG